MTLIAAQILEGSVPQMKRKGRIQVGADADLIAFDLATPGFHRAVAICVIRE